jgi:hypothetical protein
VADVHVSTFKADFELQALLYPGQAERSPLE